MVVCSNHSKIPEDFKSSFFIKNIAHLLKPRYNVVVGDDNYMPDRLDGIVLPEHCHRNLIFFTY